MGPTTPDLLTIAFWSIAYILIIIAGFCSRKTKQISMPYLPGVLNFAWELCAFIKSGFWGHLIWLALDVGIVIFGMLFLTNKKRIVYGVSLLVASIAFSYIFSLFRGMYYSVYISSLLMAIIYLVEIRKISPVFKTSIAITKLFGDIFAMLTIEKAPWLTGIMLAATFCNLIYLILCLSENPILRKCLSRLSHRS
ncbi:MAG: hypothetical protein E7455_04875 [Ruminococcaceae bacterium]|nr:hypothetical protein [Oscillospiraceae bacterium]